MPHDVVQNDFGPALWFGCGGFSGWKRAFVQELSTSQLLFWRDFGCRVLLRLESSSPEHPLCGAATNNNRAPSMVLGNFHSPIPWKELACFSEIDTFTSCAISLAKAFSVSLVFGNNPAMDRRLACRASGDRSALHTISPPPPRRPHHHITSEPKNDSGPAIFYGCGSSSEKVSGVWRMCSDESICRVGLSMFFVRACASTRCWQVEWLACARTRKRNVLRTPPPEHLL